VEGPRLALEAANAGTSPRLVVLCPELAARGGLAPELAAWVARSPVLLEVPPELFATVATTESPQGLLAVVDEPGRDVHPVLTCGSVLLLVIDGVQDPGNVGSLIRSAHALGAAAVLTVEGTGDPFGPKALRASAGACFRLPVARPARAAQVAGLLADHGVRLVGADPRGDLFPWEVDFTGKVALAVGNEAAGLGPALRGGELVRIPMAPTAESLNAAAAGAVLLYEAMRQRGRGALLRERPAAGQGLEHVL